MAARSSAVAKRSGDEKWENKRKQKIPGALSSEFFLGLWI
jgi:hypothetical protein